LHIHLAECVRDQMGGRDIWLPGELG